MTISAPSLTTQLAPQPGQPSPAPPPSIRRLTGFTVGVLALGWVGPLIDRAVGPDDGPGPGQLLWLLLPVGLAMVLRWRGGDGFADAGLRPSERENRRWYLLSSWFAPVIMFLAVAVGVSAGQFEPVDDRAPIRFVALAAAALIPVTFAAAAEEFGWRGYLTPRLDAAGWSRLKNHATVGFIWGAWHLPYLTELWAHTGESAWVVGPRLIVGSMVLAVVYGEIRLATGSVWPAVVMHAAGNTVGLALLDSDRVLARNDPQMWLVGPGADGVITIALSAIVAVGVYRHRSATA